MQPLAVSLANFISNIAASTANPFGAMMAGAVVLAIPAIVLFLFVAEVLPLQRPRVRA